MRGRRWCVGIALILVLLLGAVGAKPLIAQRPAGEGISPTAQSGYIELVGTYDTPGYAVGIAVSGTRAYVADSDKGLRIVDVSNPANPRELGFYDTPEVAQGVVASGSRAYIADGEKGLRIVDVSNSANPRELGFYDSPGVAQGVAVLGSRAYVADGWAGLRIVDVSNPAGPRELGFYDTPGDARNVVVSGTLAYVIDQPTSDWEGGLIIVDISYPDWPMRWAYEPRRYITDVAIWGTRVYLTHHLGILGGATRPFPSTGSLCGSLEILDVANPASPRAIGSACCANGYAVAAQGSLAYVGCGCCMDWGLVIFSVADPANPTIQGDFWGVYFIPVDVAVSGDLVYVVNGDLAILRYHPPSAFAFLPLALKGR